MSKKRRSRIRQTRTEWQIKIEDPLGDRIVKVSWKDSIPELLHISMALIENNFDSVRNDFIYFANFVNNKNLQEQKFIFTLSNTIDLIKKDPIILEELSKTCFKDTFEQLLLFYEPIFGVEVKTNLKPELLFKSYHQISDGRSDKAILCKYLLVQYNFSKQKELDFFNLDSKNIILDPVNVSMTMATFVHISSSEYINAEFSELIWYYNYMNSPIIKRPDDTEMEEEHFKELNIQEWSNELNTYFEEFKAIDLSEYYDSKVASVIMGFSARILELTLDVIDLIKIHKGEVAELVVRSIIESYITGSWLILNKDPSLMQRFLEYSVGREKFSLEKIMSMTEDEKIKNSVKQTLQDILKESGHRDSMVAAERGDIFDRRIDQMAEDVWGVDNLQYAEYKRYSEVIHGHWKVLLKYHVEKSLNPMHKDIYTYKDNPNRFCGLTPAYTCMLFSVDFLNRVLEQVGEKSTLDLQSKLSNFKKRVFQNYYDDYLTKYIFPNLGNE